MRRLLACLLFLIAVPTWADGRPRLSDGFDIQLPHVPVPVTVSGKSWLVYEIHLTNFDQSPLQLDAMQVRDAQHVLADLDAVALKRAIGRPDHPAKDSDPLSIPAGVRAVIYLSVEAPGASGQTIEHVIHLRHADGQEQVIHGGTFIVRVDAPVVLGSPLRGGAWTAVYNADWTRGHRRVLYTVNGRVQIPGRYAIDWIKVDDQGRHARGNGDKPADWYGYGEPVLAVADAIVADAKDDLPEPDTVRVDRKVPMEDAAGNYIALDLGQGRHVFYEHLKPGSIKVRKGDRVKLGQVIAQLGYTGSTTGPHLHLHVSDGETPLDAEGVPYVFGAYRQLGAFADAGVFGEQRPWKPEQVAVTMELPPPFAVVRFP